MENAMVCPRCQSANVNVQIATSTRLKNRGRGCVWWLLIGWWLEAFLWIFLTLPRLLIALFAPKRQKVVQKHVSMCVCQNCGYNWRA
jgi:Zn finger protein HypA/HybF involved in hydrogenase expression